LTTVPIDKPEAFDYFPLLVEMNVKSGFDIPN
jgi:hypothetical protein